MPTEEIKSGAEVVSEFLASLKGKKAIDVKTLDAVQTLFESKKLSKAQLLRSLETAREKEIIDLSATSSKKESSS